MQNVYITLRAANRCDTTSCFYEKGKKNVARAFEKKCNDEKFTEALEDKLNQNHECISSSGLEFVYFLYNAPKNSTNLDTFRYECFKKAVSRKRMVNY